MARVIGMGELLWDNFPDGRQPGGAPGNVAYHAGLLDADAAVLTSVGDDQDGRDLFTEVEAAGLDTCLIQTNPGHPTGVVEVTLTDGQPEYEIAAAAWDHITFNEAVLDELRAADAVCFGTLAQRHEDSRATIQACLAAAENALKVFDVNLRQDFYSAEVISVSLHQADVVKLNGDEVATVSELLGLPGDHTEFAAALGKTFGVRTVCITRGGDGCILYEGGETADIEGVDVELVDAVGAGDAFTAALIVTTLEGYELAARGEIANAVGALVATRRGAMPDIRPELEVMFGEEDQLPDA